MPATRNTSAGDDHERRRIGRVRLRIRRRRGGRGDQRRRDGGCEQRRGRGRATHAEVARGAEQRVDEERDDQRVQARLRRQSPRCPRRPSPRGRRAPTASGRRSRRSGATSGRRQAASARIGTYRRTFITAAPVAASLARLVRRDRVVDLEVHVLGADRVQHAGAAEVRRRSAPLTRARASVIPRPRERSARSPSVPAPVESTSPIDSASSTTHRTGSGAARVGNRRSMSSESSWALAKNSGPSNR